MARSRDIGVEKEFISPESEYKGVGHFASVPDPNRIQAAPEQPVCVTQSGTINKPVDMSEVEIRVKSAQEQAQSQQRVFASIPKSSEAVVLGDGKIAGTARGLVRGIVADVKRFRVQADRRIIQNGMACVLHAGKVVDERQYNLDQLRLQGVQLVEVEG
jgi:hypothetical protein